MTEKRNRIQKIHKTTDQRFLNMYTFDVTDKTGREFPYFVASRNTKIEDLKALTGKNDPDGVAIVAVCGENKDRVVLVRQYRYPLGNYIYEFPAGLVEKNEDYKTAGIRELREETGLVFHPIDVDPMYERPYFTTIGMTDESCATVYGYATGIPNKEGLEASEDLEIVIADRAEMKRILKEENVAIMCAYQLMHFISSDGDLLGFMEQTKNQDQ